MICEHNDCFTCPYPECIGEKAPGKKKKPGRKKMDPEEVKKHRLAYQRKYYQEHKEKYKEYMISYYYEHKEEYRAREKARRKNKGGKVNG